MSHPLHKNNAELGLRVHQHLVSKGLETPITDKVLVPAEDKIAAIAPLFNQIMDMLGLDLTDD